MENRKTYNFSTIFVSIIAIGNREFVLPSIRFAISRNAQDLDGKTQKF